MTIDREALTAKQKTVADMWLLVPGRSLDDPELEKLIGVVAMPKSRIRKEVTEVRQAIRREAELVVKHLMMKRIPHITQCQNCSESFSTDYEFNKHCSDECLRRTLEKLGLRWNPDKTPEERWQAEEIPSTITPTTLKVVLPILEQNASSIDFTDNGANTSTPIDYFNATVDPMMVANPDYPTADGLPGGTYTGIEDYDPFADII